MTTTTITNARDLYTHDATFRAGIAAWVAERRCDIRLVDLLLEHDLTAQANCALWCATEPERNPPMPIPPEMSTACGPFPTYSSSGWMWYGVSNVNSSADVPRDNFEPGVFNSPIAKGNWLTHPSEFDAILWLLDNWKSRT